jgi:hypothetical protein
MFYKTHIKMFYFPEVISDLVWSYAQTPKYKLLDWIPKTKLHSKVYYRHHQAEHMIRSRLKYLKKYKNLKCDWNYIAQNPACQDLIVEYYKGEVNSNVERAILENPNLEELLKYEHIKIKVDKSIEDDPDFMLGNVFGYCKDIQPNNQSPSSFCMNSHDHVVDFILQSYNEAWFNINHWKYVCQNRNLRVLPIIEERINKNEMKFYDWEKLYANPIATYLTKERMKKVPMNWHELYNAAKNPAYLEIIKPKIIVGGADRLIEALQHNPAIFELDHKLMKLDRLMLPLL